MKYSLRSLMVVVTLGAVVFSALAARSRYCAQRAEFHRQGLPSENEMEGFQAFVDSVPKGHGELAQIYVKRLRFRRETSAAYERVSRMPWLPLLLPEKPPEYTPSRSDVNFPEAAAQVQAIFDSQP